MSLTTIILIAGASWSILSISVGIPLGRSIKRADDAQPAAYPPPVPWPMKRPPITQADVDATWLDPWPTDDVDTLEQRVYDRLFDELVAIEGLEP